MNGSNCNSANMAPYVTHVVFKSLVRFQHCINTSPDGVFWLLSPCCSKSDPLGPCPAVVIASCTFSKSCHGKIPVMQFSYVNYLLICQTFSCLLFFLSWLISSHCRSTSVLPYIRMCVYVNFLSAIFCSQPAC